MTPLAELREVEKYFGEVAALKRVSFTVLPGEVHCLLGDNGAGKSTLIKILSGVYPPTRGEYLYEGRPVRLSSPREAMALGIATVYQDLALLPLMSVLRNFILGREPVRDRLGQLDLRRAEVEVRESLEALGIELPDLHRPVGTLSGGQRQAVAIARAVYSGAKLVILDEPTSALGVRQAAQVLKIIRRLKERGVGVVFITHNPLHALAVGDRFTVLFQGESLGTFTRGALGREELLQLMAGGQEFLQEVEG
ncbi:sugar ABC transporter ATP-binding protein [Thermus sp. LT1-2-5]|uniref:ATP-binding cassette domain-containing protein n=1 Tax=Thermus sp. LT1-2-5 TaxID=3026935 RepID=UPI0030EAAAA7